MGEEKQNPVRAGKGEKPIGAIKELFKICPELSFIIDGIERNVRRPKDFAKQKQRHSGKKKRHKIKILSSAIKVEIIFLIKILTILNLFFIIGFGKINLKIIVKIVG